MGETGKDLQEGGRLSFSTVRAGREEIDAAFGAGATFAALNALTGGLTAVMRDEYRKGQENG